MVEVSTRRSPQVGFILPVREWVDPACVYPNVASSGDATSVAKETLGAEKGRVAATSIMIIILPSVVVPGCCFVLSFGQAVGVRKM